jgi:hypothetical protein
MPRHQIVTQDAARQIDRSRRSITDSAQAISTKNAVPDRELVQAIAELDSGITTMARLFGASHSRASRIRPTKGRPGPAWMTLATLSSATMMNDEVRGQEPGSKGSDPRLRQTVRCKNPSRPVLPVGFPEDPLSYGWGASLSVGR